MPADSSSDPPDTPLDERAGEEVKDAETARQEGGEEMVKGTRDGATGGKGLGNEAVDETSTGKSVAAYSQVDRGKVIVATWKFQYRQRR